VRLITSHHKTLLLRNVSRRGQGPIWDVAPLDGWIIHAKAWVKNAFFVTMGLPLNVRIHCYATMRTLDPHCCTITWDAFSARMTQGMAWDHINARMAYMQQYIEITLVQEGLTMQWPCIILVQQRPAWFVIRNTFQMSLYSKG
jgi:hypothetical protein